jgi:hypothetical protein
MPSAPRQMTLEEALPAHDDDFPRALRGAPLIRVTEKYWRDLSPEIRDALFPYQGARTIDQGLRWFAHTVEVERLLGMEVPA